MTSARLLLLGSVLLLALVPGAQTFAAAPRPEDSTTLDVTQPHENLPALSPASSPQEVRAGIQGRFDYLALNHLAGRVFLPEGCWRIDQPLFMNGDNNGLVGAGVGKTILEPAADHGGMPLVNLSTRTYFPERPIQPCNRVLLTDAAARVLDSSVTEPRYGLRTYAEYPSTHFPAVSHLATTQEKAPAWAKGTHYQANDVIHVDMPPLPQPAELVCVREHTASAEDQPLKGAHWREDWIVKIPFHVQFFADPLTAGAYDPTPHRAGNWHSMEQFTLDFAFTLNAEPKVYRDRRVLCGVSNGNTEDARRQVWVVALHPDGRLGLDLTLEDGSTRFLVLAAGCTTAGTYRLAVQLDLAGRTVQAWVRKPGEEDFVRTLHDTAALPEGAHFRELEYGFFTITGDSGSAPNANGRRTPPADFTVCGLHTSASLRYADEAKLLRRDTRQPGDDAFRYFRNDAGTVAFLPLTDNPPTEQGTHTEAMLVTVQHGAAAGDAGQKGFGYLKSPANIMGIGSPVVEDLTLRTGPVWGVGLATWNTLDAALHRLDVRGGFYAVGDLGLGAQYTFDVRDCVLSGSEAGFSGSSNIVYFANVTFEPVGRYGVLLSGSNCMMDGVTFADPQKFHSQYYFRHLATVDYGGMNLLTNVTAEAPAGSPFPSRAAFSQVTIGGSRTSLVLRKVRVANLGSAAALIELPWLLPPCNAYLLAEGCSYRGTPICALVRSNSPWWSGEVSGFEGRSAVQKLLSWDEPPAPAWHLGQKYGKRNLVSLEGRSYECLQEHTASADNRPGNPAGEPYWVPVRCRIVFEPAATGSP